MTRSLVGVLAGALLAGLGLWLGAGEDAVPVEVVAVPPAAVWEQEGEAVFANTVLVPESLAVDGTTLTLAYRLQPLGTSPTGSGGAVPETWVATTVDGAEIAGVTANPRARAARFAVPEGFDPRRVTAIALTGWRMRIPLRYDLVVDLSATEPVLLADGTLVSIETVLRQSTDTRVRLSYDYPDDRFVGGDPGDRPFLLAGDGWENAGATLGGGAGVQIKYLGEGDPDVAPVVVLDAGWRAFTGFVPITLPEFDGG